MNNFTLDRLRSILGSFDWNHFYGSSCSTIAWYLLYDNYIRALDMIAPFVDMKVKTRENWTSTDLMNLIRKRDKHKALADKSDPDNKDFIEFKRLRGQVKRAVITSKCNYIMSKLDHSKKDSKLYWRELNDILPGKKGKAVKRDLFSLLDEETHSEIPHERLADYVNNYFTEIGPKLAAKVTNPNSDYIDSLATGSDIRIDFFEPITEVELTDFIKKIDVCKGSNILYINATLFRCCLLCTIPQVLYLFNLVLSTCLIPDDWKIANITPIFKSGNKKLISNYRPISLLPVIGKLFEKLLHNRIYDFLSETSLFNDNQCGFRPGRGVNDSIGKFLEYVYNGLNNNQSTLCIFLRP